MDKKIIDNITAAWQEVVMNEKKKLDPVDKDELKGKHADRDDKDVDNDGDVDASDEFLHKRRKAISKDMKEEEDADDVKMDPKGMKKCGECGGSSENHDEECGKYKGESKAKSESVRHEQHGFGEIISESDEGVDVLFDHGVEFNVPAEQLEGVSSAIKTAKRMGGNMTGAVKKIDKFKKGMSDNPRVQKALKKANEEDELEEKLEKERVKHPNGQRPKGPGWVLKKSGEQSGKPHSEWERKTKTVESVQEGTVAEFDEQIQDTYSSIQQQAIQAMKNMWEFNEHPKSSGPDAGHKKDAAPAETMKDKRKGKAADDMANDLDADNPELAGDDAIGHDDVSKAARAVKTQAAKRGGEERIGNLSPEMPADTTKVGKGGL
tara:strand:- start:22 stop:1155 length:1134 start_codon:yes stop_codon:yes gene_type:complete